MRKALLAAVVALSLAAPALPAWGQGAGARWLDPEEVAAEVRRFIASQLSLGPGEAEVRSIHMPAQRVLLPAGPHELRVELPAQGRLLGRTPLMVTVRDAAGAEVRKLWVTAEVAVYAEVPVARAPLRAQQALDPALFETRKKDLATLPPDAVTRLEDLEGARLLRPLAPGDVVRRPDVEVPHLVLQGHLVRILARRGALVITAVGKALDSGRKGESIRVINIDSNRLLQGRVVERSAVEVLF
ncbi:MAG: flagellar basal body P-ring formation chaperone FlgA [Nitrospinota bacterium]